MRFESLSLKTPPKTVPPTPGTALQLKIESILEKSLGSQFNIQLQQQMGVFQASMLEVMKSLRDEFQSFKKMSKELEVDQTSTSASKPGTSKQTEDLDPTPPRPPPRTQPSSHTDEAMEVDLYGIVWYFPHDKLLYGIFLLGFPSSYIPEGAIHRV